MAFHRLQQESKVCATRGGPQFGGPHGGPLLNLNGTLEGCAAEEKGSEGERNASNRMILLILYLAASYNTTALLFKHI